LKVEPYTATVDEVDGLVNIIWEVPEKITNNE
jgi:hypothetical protein